MAVNSKDGTPNLAEDKKGETSQIVAEKLGIGGKETYRKEKYIVDNADTLTPEDFADCDEGKLSTNKAYLKIKEQLAARNANSPTIDTYIDLLGKLKRSGNVEHSGTLNAVR